jgi:hypothetical protein
MTDTGMSGIIVRDDAARESFKTEIGKVGVTLYVRLSLCCFRYSVATRTLFNSKGLEYDDVSLSSCANANPSLPSHFGYACLCIKVILYNFFEESAAENLWQYLMDEKQHKLLESKHVPLIHEVSDRVDLQTSETLLLPCFKA